jgi:isoleucyl-tRNA synthetase
VQRELEKLRGAGTIGKSLEAKVKLSSSSPETRQALQSVDLTSILIVSEAVVENGGTEALKIQVEKSTYPKCDRCWNLRADVGKNAAHPALCGRCVAVVG